jgi:high affinity Mn2+ porin
VIRYAIPRAISRRVLTRAGRGKTGGINIKQQLAASWLFLRASMADGRYETVAYTDVDRQLDGAAAGALWDV